MKRQYRRPDGTLVTLEVDVEEFQGHLVAKEVARICRQYGWSLSEFYRRLWAPPPPVNPRKP